MFVLQPVPAIPERCSALTTPCTGKKEERAGASEAADVPLAFMPLCTWAGLSQRSPWYPGTRLLAAAQLSLHKGCAALHLPQARCECPGLSSGLSGSRADFVCTLGLFI